MHEERMYPTRLQQFDGLLLMIAIPGTTEATRLEEKRLRGTWTSQNKRQRRKYGEIIDASKMHGNKSCSETAQVVVGH